MNKEKKTPTNSKEKNEPKLKLRTEDSDSDDEDSESSIENEKKDDIIGSINGSNKQLLKSKTKFVPKIPISQNKKPTSSFMNILSPKKKVVRTYSSSSIKTSKSNESSINLGEDDLDKSSPFYKMNIFFCPKCNSMPQIELMLNDTVRIHCKCFSKDYFYSDDENNTKDFKTLSKYSEYEVSLDKYIIEAKSEHSYPLCSEDKNHMPKETKTFCATCQKYYCNNCLKNHDKNHILYPSLGLALHLNCENNNCEDKNIISFYCTNCSLHLCSKCKENHNIKHNIIELNKFFNEDLLNNIKTEIKSICSLNKTLDNNYKRYLDALKKRINDCENLFKQKQKKFDKMFDYYESLLNTYELTHLVPNYNIRNNIFLYYSKINNIMSYKKTLFEQSIKTLINNYTFEVFSKPSFFVAEYFIPSNKQNECQLFGDDFNKFNFTNCIMTINGIEEKFKKEYSPILNKKIQVKIQMKSGEYVDSLECLFSNCKNLINVDFSNFDTSLIKNLSGIFSECSALKTVKLNNINTILNQNMECMFSNCINLKTIESINELKTENVLNLGGVFCNCKKLSNLNLSKWNTSNVIHMEYLFSDCDSLNEVNVRNWNTYQTVYMSTMFYRCYHLSIIKGIEEFRTDNVNDMECMFSLCYSLTYLNLSNWDTSNVFRLKGMFNGCFNLLSLGIGDQLLTNVYNKLKKFINIPIPDGADPLTFIGNSDITSIIGFGKNLFLLHDLTSIFEKCDKLDSRLKNKFILEY